MLTESDRFCYHLPRLGGVIWEIPVKRSLPEMPAKIFISHSCKDLEPEDVDRDDKWKAAERTGAPHP